MKKETSSTSSVFTKYKNTDMTISPQMTSRGTVSALGRFIVHGRVRLAAKALHATGWRNGFTLLELMLSIGILGVLVAVALPAYGKYTDRVKTNQAIQDIALISVDINHYAVDNGNQYPATLSDVGRAGMLDPWGHPYQYLNLTTLHGHGQARKDHGLVPINTDFDLYSMGKDGASVSPLTAQASRDDIVRANNGTFIGLASDYDH
jgi:general secretion pathway protein G